MDNQAWVVRPYAIKYQLGDDVEEVVELAYTADDAATQLRIRAVGMGRLVQVLEVGPYIVPEEEDADGESEAGEQPS